MRGARAAWAAMAAVGGVAAVLLLSGFRGTTRRSSAGDYINDIRVTADGVYRFHPTQQGNTTSATAYRRVTFLDVYNGTAGEATLTLFTASAPGTTVDSVLVSVPTLASRSWPGAPIDSVRVTATFAGADIILGGMD